MPASREFVTFLVVALAGGYFLGLATQQSASLGVDTGIQQDATVPHREPKRQPNPGDYALVADGLSDTALLQRLRDDLDIWRASPNRLECVEVAFGRLAKTLGSKRSIEAALELIAFGKFAPDDGDVIVSMASIAAFAEQNPSHADLVDLLKQPDVRFGKAILAAYAPSLGALPFAESTANLVALMTSAGWKMSADLEAFAVALSVCAVETVDLASIVPYILKESSRLNRDELPILVLAHIGHLRPHLASEIGSEIFGGILHLKPRQLTEVVRSLHLSPMALGKLAMDIPLAGRNKIVSAYMAQYQSPLDVVRIASAFHADDLSPNVTAKIAAGLLAFGGGQLREWLGDLPAKTQADILINSYKELGDFPDADKAFAWLQVARNVSGLDSKAIVAAIEAAADSQNVSDKELFDLCELCPPDDRRWIALDIHRRKLKQITSENWIAVIESFPVDVRDEMKKSALKRISRQDGEMTFALYENAKTQAERQMIRDVLLNSPIYLPSMDKRWAMILDGLRDETVSQELTYGLDRYVEDVAFTDGHAAAKVLNQLPDGPIRAKAIDNLARVWVEAEPMGASEWITQMPPGAVRDAALVRLVQGTRGDAANALVNAAAIGDGAQRLHAAGSVLEFWHTADPDTARRILADAPLPETDKVELAKILAPAKVEGGN